MFRPYQKFQLKASNKKVIMQKCMPAMLAAHGSLLSRVGEGPPNRTHPPPPLAEPAFERQELL